MTEKIQVGLNVLGNRRAARSRSTSRADRSLTLVLVVGLTSRRNRVNHLGGGVFLSKICTFAFKFLKFAHFLAHLGGG